METEKVVSQDANGKKGGRTTVIVLLVIVIIALIGVVVFLLLPKDVEDPTISKGTVVTKENVEEILNDTPQTKLEDPGQYNVTMSSDWVFADGESISSNAYVENSEINTTPVRFEIFMADDETDVIYRSQILPVGSTLEGLALDKDLKAGTYDTVVKYILVDEEGNDLSYVRVTLKIIVQN